MLPPFPATFPSSDVGAPFADFNTGFTTWDDLSSLFEPIPTLPKPDPNDPTFYSSTSPVDFSSTRYHSCFDSPPSDPNPDSPSPESEETPPTKIGSDSKTGLFGLGCESDLAANFSTSPDTPGSDPAGFDAPNSPGSDQNSLNPGEPVSTMEERKRKRKLSNRESARRSRMRKQKHLENIVVEANRLETENRELTNRLKLVNYYLEITRRDNERLLGDCVFLQRRLTLTTQFLHSRQLHTYNIQTQ